MMCDQIDVTEINLNWIAMAKEGDNNWQALKLRAECFKSEIFQVLWFLVE